MPRMNRTAAPMTLLPAILLAAACTHYQGPRGPEAEALFELYNGDWVLDADASDPTPEPPHPPLVLTAVATTGTASGPTLGPPPCPPGQLCRDRPESGGREESESPSVPDSAVRHTHGRVATHQPARLTLLFSEAAMRVSPSGLGIPLEVPMDSRRTEVEQGKGGAPVKAWSGWKDGSPSLTISVGDDESWVSDTYELPGDGTLVVTRELGGGYFFRTMQSPRFVYRRVGAPSP